MNLEVWFAFVVAVFVFCIIPGPTVILVISQAMSHGKRSVIPLVLGVLVGDFTAMLFSLLGLGAILAASSALFSFLKWLGAGYLIYLGLKTLLSKVEVSVPKGGEEASVERSPALFRSAFLVTALNPKGIVFFVAFLPQFINPESAFFPQLSILVVSFLFIVSLNITFYTLFASKLRERIQSYRAKKWFNRFSGGLLLAAGGVTARMQNN